jgi:plastocyanin
MRLFWRFSCGAACIAVLASTLQGQGVVYGQVSIQERPGEVSEDLANTVVFLEPVATSGKNKTPSPTNTTIALEKRQFSPRVRVVVEGSKVDFPNQDPWNHNVFSKANGGFDTGVFGRGKTKDQKFDQAGVYSLYCNVHPRMTGFVIALKTPYFTQAGVDGRYSFENIPAGQYRLNVWHDRTSLVTKDVTVPATGLANLRTDLDARGYKYVQHKNKFGQTYTSTGDRY